MPARGTAVDRTVDRAQAESLIQAEDERGARERGRIGEHLEREAAQPTGEPAPPRARLRGDDRARRFDEMSVGDTRRTHDLAGPTGKATIQMQAGRVAGRPALEHVQHQVDPAARGFGLKARDLVRRSGPRESRRRSHRCGRRP